MKNSIVAYVGWLLVFCALGFYLYGMEEAIHLSWPSEPAAESIPYFEVLSTTIGSLQALLLANLGMVLGIPVANRNSGFANGLKVNKAGAPTPPASMKEQIQMCAVVIYVLILVAYFVTWIGKIFPLTQNKWH